MFGLLLHGCHQYHLRAEGGARPCPALERLPGRSCELLRLWKAPEGQEARGGAERGVHGCGVGTLGRDLWVPACCIDEEAALFGVNLRSLPIPDERL